jgi:hypothetical protein
MDGCTFSYGGIDPKKAPLVAHANFQDNQFAIDQVEIDYQLTLVNPGAYTALKKSEYTKSKHFNVGSGHVRSTTFGISDGTNWKFYSQKWEDHHRAVARKQSLTSMDPATPGYGSQAWDDELKAASSTYELLGVDSRKGS